MPVVVVPATSVGAAWTWLRTSIPARPAPAADFIYNDLGAWTDTAGRLLHAGPQIVSQLVILYLASHAGQSHDLLSLLRTDQGFDVEVAGTRLDGEVKKLYKNKTRFRASLGEHIAFWITAAQHRHIPGAFSISQPHHLSEDKGPDGIVLRLAPTPQCEVVSVKQSPANIKALMSSAPFRRGNAPKPKKMLDDLYKFAKQGYGFARAEKIIAGMISVAQVPTATLTASALLMSSHYQGVALSSHAAASDALYRGFHRIGSASRCVATFVGSPDWSTLAVAVRSSLEARLRTAGVW